MVFGSMQYVLDDWLNTYRIVNMDLYDIEIGYYIDLYEMNKIAMDIEIICMDHNMKIL